MEVSVTAVRLCRNVLNQIECSVRQALLQRYEVLNSVGEGTYGLVLRCVHKCTGTHVAIKKFKESKDEERVGLANFPTCLLCSTDLTPALCRELRAVSKGDIVVQVRRTAARELDVVRSLHHTNLVSFLESFRANGKLHLVFEFMDRTLLHDMEQMPHGIPEETVESYMLQLVEAVQFLHQNKVGSIPYELTSGLAVMAYLSGTVGLIDFFRCAPQ